ncbi:hypothetical protein Acr_05g0006580 [Actinidia rufa]|uniref:Uncharacterized protein n=1 Tax=Actinidia rufa TaxID=165716 RepID=A0A7J0EM10_9ERIC|nr:hypothetical protein Acr_05g0006580 [Actinidia rufa]
MHYVSFPIEFDDMKHRVRGIGEFYPHFLNRKSVRERLKELLDKCGFPSFGVLVEEWRIQMLPIQFLFLTVWPVIDMKLKCKSQGLDYPPQIPQHITKLVELDIIRWELQGLDDILKPSEFTLGVKGTMYPERRGTQSRLKGQLQMSISFVLPPVFALVPEDVRREVAQSVLKRLVENMKHKVNGSLLADYSEFKREKLLKA